MKKIYTRTGDSGETGLFGGGRVAKDHVRVSAYGTVDELNASVGTAVAAVDDARIREWLRTIQHDLFVLGSILATPLRPDGSVHSYLPPLPSPRIAEMEGWIDAADEELPPLTEFILPGGNAGAAELHRARTVCRRAEREVVGLARDETVDPDVIRYLNRLSDLLFALARLENHRAGVADVIWEK